MKNPQRVYNIHSLKLINLISSVPLSTIYYLANLLVGGGCWNTEHVELLKVRGGFYLARLRALNT